MLFRNATSDDLYIVRADVTNSSRAYAKRKPAPLCLISIIIRLGKLAAKLLIAELLLPPLTNCERGLVFGLPLVHKLGMAIQAPLGVSVRLKRGPQAPNSIFFSFLASSDFILWYSLADSPAGMYGPSPSNNPDMSASLLACAVVKKKMSSLSPRMTASGREDENACTAKSVHAAWIAIMMQTELRLFGDRIVLFQMNYVKLRDDDET
jgi:hypothetical protein